MTNRAYRVQRPRPPGLAGVLASLLGLAVLLAGLGVVLIVGIGLPTLPTLSEFVDASRMPLTPASLGTDLLAVSRWVVWAAWAWACVSVLLDAALLIASQGPAFLRAWAQCVHRATDRLMLPLARPAIVAAAVTQLLAARPVALAQTTAAETAQVQADQQPPLDPATGRTSTPAPRDDPAVRWLHRAAANGTLTVVHHTVQHGETIGLIARRYYGAAEEFDRLLDANLGTVMPSGRVLDRSGIVEPGTVLTVPLPSTSVIVQDGVPYYVVERYDTLWGISARLLGDPLRWPEIFALNRGLAALPDGHILRNPNLIWPNLRLRLPADALGMEPAPPEDTPPPVPAAPAPPEAAPATLPAPTQVPTSQPATAVPAVYATATAVPVAAVTTALSNTSTSDTGLPPWWPAVLAAAGGTGAIALGLLALRRRVPANELQPGEHGGLAVRPAAKVFVGSDPTELLAGELVRLGRAAGMTDIDIVAAYQDQATTNVVLSAPPEARSQLPLVLQVAGRHLADRISANATPDRDVDVLLVAPRPAAVLRSTTDVGAPLVSLGALADGRELLGGWDALGHTLLVAQAGSQSAEHQLRATVAMLAATRSPDRLLLYTCTASSSPVAALEALPHQRVVTTQGETMSTLLTTLEEQQPTEKTAETPLRVLVVADLAALSPEDQAAIARLVGSGQTAVRVFAATTDAALAAGSLGQAFSSHMVFYLDDADLSVRVLGGEDAVTLHPDSGMLVRIGGRTRLFQTTRTELADEDLRDLLAAMSVSGSSPVVEEADQSPDTAHGAVEVEDGTLLSTGSPEQGQPMAISAVSQQHAADCGKPAFASHVVAVERATSQGVADAETDPAVQEPAPAVVPPPHVDRLLANAPFVLQCMDGPLLWYRDGEGASRLLGPGTGPGMLPLARGLEVLLFVAVAPLWRPDLRGADKNDLLSVLWPNVPENKARRNLSTALSHLRAALVDRGAPPAEPLHVEQDGERILLNEQLIVSDVDTFRDLEERAARGAADLEAAIAAYGGPLLPHVSQYQARRGKEAASGLPLGWLDESPASTAAGKLEDRLRGVLLRRARQLGTMQHWAAAAEVYREVLHTNGRLQQPPNSSRAEEAALGILTAVAEQGDPTALTAAYEMLQTSMPYGVSAQLERRYEELIEGESSRTREFPQRRAAVREEREKNIVGVGSGSSRPPDGGR